ncbi:PAX3 and PAX7 binding protein 1 L homeolog [Xenopus laevis]|uniref:MGC115437 protein n=1 Tax=Xenopus laevis TaxID=8355 RepID=Q4V7S1_XENLA|nr:PAX3 and PAX7 binding protein 1 L homeolog [Xenopus laevis]AAH97749.1 MGC115437 protein [Xenopus laevis]
MFRKIRRVNVRKRNDSEEEERETGTSFTAPAEHSEPMVSAAERPVSIPLLGPDTGPPRGRKEGNSLVSKGGSLLSFQDDVDDEEIFTVKKSNYSKKIVKLLKKEYKDDLDKTKPKPIVANSSADGDGFMNRSLLPKDGIQENIIVGSDLGEEEMEVESEKEEEKPKAGSFTNAVSSLNVLRPGEIPDAAFIHAARKKRQMARELGDAPSVDGEGGGKSRLVREDENDASDDEDDDKRRIVFSVREKCLH